MARWEIAKEFDFCYGHRVHTQTLNELLSLTSHCKCRHLHGHQGKIIVHLEGKSLDERGMLIDFVELNWFKKWVDDVIDHKMIIDRNDPGLIAFFPLAQHLNILWNDENCYGVIKPEVYNGYVNKSVSEIYGGLVIVDFVPTSENICKWLHDIVQSRLQSIAKVSRIQFFETPKSQSNYYSN